VIPNLRTHTPTTERRARWVWAVDRLATAGPVPDLSGGTPGGKPCRLRPNSVTVGHQLVNGVQHTSVNVSGKRVKKDGTSDVVSASTVFTLREEMPDWLWELVADEVRIRIFVRAGEGQ